MSTPSKPSPDELFSAQIDAADQEEVMTILAEAVQGVEHDCVTFHDHERINAISAHGSGVLTWKGREFAFHVVDGDNNGTELRGWEEAGEVFEPHQPTVYVLAPRPDLVVQANVSGNGAFLVAKWDALLSREPYASMAGKYAYDRMMQPGSMITSHYEKAAAAGGFVWMEEQEAKTLRERMSAPVVPAPEGPEI